MVGVVGSINDFIIKGKIQTYSIVYQYVRKL